MISNVKFEWGLFGSAVLLARAHFPEQRLVIEPKISLVCNSYNATQDWLREQCKITMKMDPSSEPFELRAVKDTMKLKSCILSLGRTTINYH